MNNFEVSKQGKHYMKNSYQIFKIGSQVVRYAVLNSPKFFIKYHKIFTLQRGFKCFVNKSYQGSVEISVRTHSTQPSFGSFVSFHTFQSFRLRKFVFYDQEIVIQHRNHRFEITCFSIYCDESYRPIRHNNGKHFDLQLFHRYSMNH